MCQRVKPSQSTYIHIHKEMEEVKKKKKNWRTEKSKCYQMLLLFVSLTFVQSQPLISLYVFESVLHSFPHFRWFTTVLAVKTGVMVSGVVKVGDDS